MVIPTIVTHKSTSSKYSIYCIVPSFLDAKHRHTIYSLSSIFALLCFCILLFIPERRIVGTKLSRILDFCSGSLSRHVKISLNAPSTIYIYIQNSRAPQNLLYLKEKLPFRQCSVVPLSTLFIFCM